MILLIQQKSWWSWLWDNWLVDIIIKGGPYIMVPLFIFSVISMGIIIERIYRYLKIPKDKKIAQMLEEVEEILRTNKKIEPVVKYFENKKNALSFVFLSVLKRYEFLLQENRSINDMRQELMDTAVDSTSDYLEEFLPIVATIANVATLLGLFGTIIGMIMSFDELAKGGRGDPAVVAHGISVALLTTAAGLTVAIPSVLGYSFLRRRAEKITKHLEPFENHFVNTLLHEHGRIESYRAIVASVYRNGSLTEEGGEYLRRKRIELDISDEEARAIEDEVIKSLKVKKE
ncbi:biopolymer transport protein ExbB [Candidatus Kryptonium thompsonii]|uniref:Biopolymer transport protein ExbB n=3 Tax=Candidatus Kryptonium thompsonii TaxID=1633631 RepID=A0A0P1LVJ1_9BACT|nr:MotA/TolQ/ExbB proton channel family protein [Candidatus Kryptonium thompsoni]CUS80393.1 biopolymer transport protein ExbB [Candidatus Kryptonium thompsoni]CUS82238.1 biopolymer transport protein ExbB [Candidatus Kryptonium thompsoni]CUS83215.1 biopolymer transport protein ExbB [Candidatus Kryptonium thompsoni]CUS85839.1 biopolymer transport protein ExbB [Candidatus Kryptonium thompsoni]CUS85889.1 biopolymer transport protein ExbB [Candidatus Kryptonium thompsoni]